MLSIITFRAVCQIVSWCKFPFSIITNERKILNMIILVLTKHVENHPSEHLQHIFGRLSNISGKSKQNLIIRLWWMNRLSKQSSGRNNMHPLTFCINIKSFARKVFIIQQLKFRNMYTTRQSALRIFIFHFAYINRIINMAKLHYPTSFFIMIHCLRSTTS